MGRTARKSEVIEWPKRSGIRIRMTRNRKKIAGVLRDFGEAFVVNVPRKLAGKRLRPQFTTLDKAKGMAEKLYAKSQEEGFRAFAMTPADREDAARALALLSEANIKTTLADAIQLAIPHLKPEGGRKTLVEVVTELAESKQRRADKKKISKRTVDTFNSLSAALVDDLGSKWINEISKDHIYSWLKEIAEDESARTVKNYRVNAGEVFKYACQKRYLTVSPLFYIPREEIKELEDAAEQNKQPAILTVDDAYRLLDCAAKHPRLNLQAVVIAVLFCGVRTEEAQKLTWDDIKLDRDKPFISVGPAVAKKRRIRNIDLEPLPVRLFLGLPNRTGLIAGDYKEVGWYTKRFTKLCRLAGFHAKTENGKWVSQWGNNAMRHSFGSYHFALHGDSILTSRLMGHRQGDEMLFAHYRALTSKEDAEKYFQVEPTTTRIPATQPNTKSAGNS